MERSESLAPRMSDWERYWSLDQTQRFTKISWSKRRILKILEPFVQPRKKALDAGCGSGFFSRYFCDQGMETVSLDYSLKALEMARQATSGRTRTLRADLLEDRLADQSGPFDIVFTDGLLEHFSQAEQENILRNLMSVLDKQGVIVTFVPNRWSPWELIRPWYMPNINEDPFILRDLISLHRSQGLQVFSSGGINTVPFAFSPDRWAGRWFGMLLYTVAKR